MNGIVLPESEIGMSKKSRRALLGLVLVCSFFIGSVAPASSEAKVTKKDLLEMDQKILDELKETQDLVDEVNTNVGEVLPTVNKLSDKLDQALAGVVSLAGRLEEVLPTVRNLTGTLDQVLATVGGLTGELDQVLSIVDNLGGKLDQVLALVGDLTGTVTGLLSPLTCSLLGICPEGTASQ